MLLRGGATRLMERLTGRDPFERRYAAHRANAEFLAGMGLDPDRVLGPPPERTLAPATVTDPVGARTAVTGLATAQAVV
ncbi:hypothetical protein G1H10_08890 [Phytoactinopolyspora halotolerans]|uniref:Uncharacterized protein n=2 Tax=Phytoactinopolyspora halotolerans TaxID=1981512 RepID=A0A6L9S6K8_9ACTN|nr:hypothetical protein [Phytoactinopolyspora halotolerans]